MAAQEWYVAPTGKDTNPGTQTQPFATLEGARQAIRKPNQPTATRRAQTVWVRGGDYLLNHGVKLNAEDSGTPEAPVVYRAFNHEKVRFLGGPGIKDFQPVKDPAILARLDTSARAAIRQIDLRALGITNFGQFHSRGFGRPAAPSHLELFFDGQPMTVARWPNEGEWEKIAPFPDSAVQPDEHGGKLGPLAAGFYYAGDRPKRWRDLSEVWIHGYWAYDWANSYEKVAAIELEKHLIKTAPPYGHYGFRAGQRVYFLNLLEELDQPGEWFLDRHTGMLYFWPPKAIGQAEVLVSLLEEPMVQLNQVSNVVFRGFNFLASRGRAFELIGGASNRIEGCKLALLGGTAVSIEGGHGQRVLGCDIENTGDAGVSLSGGNRQTLEPGGHAVENCHFQKQGRWSKCYVPAILMNGVGNRAAHNLIHDHPHCAILFGGNDHVVEFNEIHHIALETGDVGAIYMGRDYSFRGNVIRHNFIHHTGGVGMGSMGVYMDDCVSGTLIYGNVFYQVSRAAFLGGGRDHRVENNLFVACQPAVDLDGRGLDKAPVWHNMVYGFMKEQLGKVPQDLYRQRYPAIKDLDRYYAADNGIPPEGNVVARNICLGGKWLNIGWHAKTNLVEIVGNYVSAETNWVNASQLDFRLAKDAPVWNAGFQPIPLERIGLQKDELRNELP
jgi:hypothetical protein